MYLLSDFFNCENLFTHTKIAALKSKSNAKGITNKRNIREIIILSSENLSYTYHVTRGNSS